MSQCDICIPRWAVVSGQVSVTMIIVPGEVLPVDEEVVVLVQLPELAVDDVEVLVAEELRDLVDVLLVLEDPQDLEEVGSAHLGDGDAAGPGTVHAEEDSGYHLKGKGDY